MCPLQESAWEVKRKRKHDLFWEEFSSSKRVHCWENTNERISCATDRVPSFTTCNQIFPCATAPQKNESKAHPQTHQLPTEQQKRESAVFRPNKTTRGYQRSCFPLLNMNVSEARQNGFDTALSQHKALYSIVFCSYLPFNTQTYQSSIISSEGSSESQFFTEESPALAK